MSIKRHSFLCLKIDLEFLEYLGESEIPFCIVFTKSDKLGKNKVNSHVDSYKKQLLAGDWAEMPPYFITSSLDAVGREPILEYINGINEELFKDEGF